MDSIISGTHGEILGPDSEPGPTTDGNDPHYYFSRTLEVRVEASSSTVEELHEEGPDGTRRVRLQRDSFATLTIKAEIVGR